MNRIKTDDLISPKYDQNGHEQMPRRGESVKNQNNRIVVSKQIK